MKYVLDTNLYIRAFRSAGEAEALKSFYNTFAPVTYLNSVVGHELLVSASTPAKVRSIKKNVVAPMERRRHVITPSHSTWQLAGDAIARMARKTRRDLRSLPKSLTNDYLLAASCWEHGATLVTLNLSDFEEIREYLSLEYVAPWPG